MSRTFATAILCTTLAFLAASTVLAADKPPPKKAPAAAAKTRTGSGAKRRPERSRRPRKNPGRPSFSRCPGATMRRPSNGPWPCRPRWTLPTSRCTTWSTTSWTIIPKS